MLQRRTHACTHVDTQQQGKTCYDDTWWLSQLSEDELEVNDDAQGHEGLNLTSAMKEVAGGLTPEAAALHSGQVITEKKHILDAHLGILEEKEEGDDLGEAKEGEQRARSHVDSRGVNKHLLIMPQNGDKTYFSDSDEFVAF